MKSCGAHTNGGEEYGWVNECDNSVRKGTKDIDRKTSMWTLVQKDRWSPKMGEVVEQWLFWTSTRCKMQHGTIPVYQDRIDGKKALTEAEKVG